MKITITLLIFLISFCAFSQRVPSSIRTKKVAAKNRILIDSLSINPSYFVIKNNNGVVIDTSLYRVNFSKATLTLKTALITDTLIIEYLRFPRFLTKTYKQLDEARIVKNTNNLDKLYKLSRPNTTRTFKPFDGLNTSGSISRGVTIGNNQNSVVNSELDLQITGKLNDKVSLRASIQDANIPLQERGFSQRLDEFDQVFIELLSKNWNIRAGDIDLQKTNSIFGNFSKRVQGLNVNASLLHKNASTKLFASGALVRGQFGRSQFTAQEGNQGPYKLEGPNGELFVLIVSGSETVYVNGVALSRGEDKDYVINYNAGELVFNATFPVTSEMRVTVDYQFTERNFSRFIAYGGGYHTTEKLKIGVSVYSETDARNQPLQQNLSQEQVQLLELAGDDRELMTAPSAVAQSFDENRILYRKDIIGVQEVFVFSNNPDDELFDVRFTLVGDNQGDYVLTNNNAIANVFEFIAPIAGVPQGNFAPVTQLVSPVKLQVAVVNGTYTPTKQTTISFETAASINDLNLFSSLDDEDNTGFAADFKINQTLIKKDSLWALTAFANSTFVQDNFKTIEQLYNVEFNRDWNINTPLGNQSLINTGVELHHNQGGLVKYHFEHLNYAQNFNGNKHSVSANFGFKKLNIFSNSSVLNATSNSSNSRFLRSYNRFIYTQGKSWLGAKFALESNEQRLGSNDSLTGLSQKFRAYETFAGLGDSTKVFFKLGYKNRVNDSVRNNRLQSVNTSNTYYLDTKLFQNSNTNLSLYVNYRVLKNNDTTLVNEQSLNSRLQYSQKLINRLLLWNTVFETNSGTLPQQEFTFVEVDPGQGVFQFIDFNENGIRELDEFETATFQDQANFIRVFLPNQVFIQTHQNRLSQTLTFNPKHWELSKHGVKKFWSHFHNQTSYLIDRRIRRNGNNFNVNPFQTNAENQLGLQLNIRNVLFFNRGLQRYTSSYTYLSNKSQNVLSIGFVENELTSHQLNFNHKFATHWLFSLASSFEVNQSNTENFANRNFSLDQTEIAPRLSYLLNDNTQFNLFYSNSTKDNTLGMESLNQQNLGLSFSFANAQKAAISGEFNFFSNDFLGNANTPVGFQILEGLQPGRNFTWRLLAQKKLTKFLDLNLNYLGRKSENSRTIHTGTIQLKAYF